MLFRSGHPVDNLYLRIERPGTEEMTLLLRPDEVSALVYVLNGALWSWLASAVEDGKMMFVESRPVEKSNAANSNC